MGAIIKAAVRIAVLLALGPGLQACASVTTGVEQTVAVSTAPSQPASCTLQNERGQWTVVRTPGTASVAKAYGPLSVRCKTDEGQVGLTSIPSTTAGAVFGNLIAGGLIGAAIDMGSGAAYRYPSSIVVAIAGSSPPVAAPLPMAATPPSPPTALPTALPAGTVPIAPPASVAQVSVVQPPARIFCRRLGKVQEYRDEEWCRQTGGTVVSQPTPDATPVTAPPPMTAASPANRLSADSGTAAPVAAGTCYLPDGRQAPMTKETCAAQNGFIGA